MIWFVVFCYAIESRINSSFSCFDWCVLYHDFWIFSILHGIRALERVNFTHNYGNILIHTCWHVMKSATHTQIPANPWAVFVCRKIPSAACNLSGSMSSAPLCVCSVVTLAIRFDCVGTMVEVVVEMMAAVIVVDAVEFSTLSGDDPDIISFSK